MSRIAYVNGSYCDLIRAYTHVEDRGYQFADGVYEVFAVIDKHIIDYDGHIERLYRSLGELKMKSPINKKSYIFHIRNIIKKNLLHNGTIYLQITRGIAPRDFKFPKNSKESLVIIAKNLPFDYFSRQFNRGINVKLVKDLRWKRVDIKTLNLLPPVLAKQLAYENNCEEAWLVDDEGYITEGSSSNAWILCKGKLITRPISNFILNGITRNSLIKALDKINIKLVEKKFNINDIKKADEAFITSATQLVTPVIKIDNFKIGSGQIGPMSKKFREAYMEAVQLS